MTSGQLRRDDQAPRLEGTGHPAGEDGREPAAERRQILLVDDDALEGLLLDGFLRQDPGLSDCDLRHVTTLHEALRLLEAAAPALILLDNRLVPYRDFRETVPAIRGAGHRGPLVVISATLMDEAFQEAPQHGVTACLDKLTLSSGGLAQTLAPFLPPAP